jgi:hypothetical protein
MGQSASSSAIGRSSVTLPSQVASASDDDQPPLTARPVKQWTSRHVQQWLHQNELAFCADAFARLSVNGAALRDITDADLQTDFRVAESFQRRRLLTAIGDLLRSEGVVPVADVVHKRHQAVVGTIIIVMVVYCLWKLLRLIFER